MALRPRQWSKNALVLAALIFSGHVFEVGFLARAVLGAILFCLVSSAVYLINDTVDVKKDRSHPVKRLRPVASGALGVAQARWAAILLLAGSLTAAVPLSLSFAAVLGAYVALSLAYCFALKHIALVDVFVLSAGFVLRAVGGALVIGVAISDWFFVCTMLLALFVSLCKRRSEVVLLGATGNDHRSVLAKYPPELLDQVISAIAGAIIVCYSLYTLWPETVHRVGSTDLKYTIPFVVFGIARYLYVVHHTDRGGAPEQVFLTDPGMILTVLGWALAVFLVIYV